MKLKTLTSLVCALTIYATLNAQDCQRIFISEYVAGTGNNKAIELYNPTGEPIDLDGYVLERWANGEQSATDQLSLEGVIPPFGTWVIVNGQTEDIDLGTFISPASDPELRALADQLGNPYPDPTFLNGNDALVLLNYSFSSPVLDIFGKPGQDPGVFWSSPDGTITTASQSLVRKAEILAGVTQVPSLFNPAEEWISLGLDNWTNLGQHDCACGESGLTVDLGPDQLLPQGQSVTLSAMVNGSFDISSFAAPLTGFDFIGCLNGNCYDVSQNLTDWNDASAIAASNDGFLATVTTPEENALLSNSLTQPGGAFIGLFQNTDSPDFSEPGGGWEWITGEPLDYTNWFEGEPNNFLGDGPENVGMISSSQGQWLDIANYPRRFIVERNIISYLWSTGDTTETITVSPAVSTQYTLTISNGNFSATDTVFIEVPCGAQGGTLTVISGPDDYCIGDGLPNFVEVSVSGNQGLLNRYGIANANTLGILGGNNNGLFNLENYPPGDYLIGHITYNDPGFFDNVSNVIDLDGCYAISNFVSVSTYAVDAGIISLNENPFVCLDDEVPSILSFNKTGSTGPNQRWAVLNQTGSSVLANNNSGTFNFDLAPVGIYQVVHVAWGDFSPNLIDLQNPTGCVDISNPILVIVENCESGLVEISSKPNPVSETSVVEFVLPSSGNALLEVYDTSGRNIQTLYSGLASADDVYRFQFDVSQLPQGVYLYRLTGDQTVVTEKFIVSR